LDGWNNEKEGEHTIDVFTDPLFRQGIAYLAARQVGNEKAVPARELMYKLREAFFPASNGHNYPCTCFECNYLRDRLREVLAEDKVNELRKLNEAQLDEVRGLTGSYIKLKESIQDVPPTDVPVGTRFSVNWDPATRQWVRRRLA